MPQTLIPYIPETAPFSEEQRQWLNGFFAGLFTGAPTAGATGPVSAAVEKKPVLILFGSQTGNAEGLAKKLKTEAEKRGTFAPKLSDLAQFDAVALPKESHLLLVTSTWGEGDPPDNAAGFWDKISAARFSAPRRTDVFHPRARRPQLRGLLRLRPEV